MILCVALELFLEDVGNPVYLRFAAGVMLVRVWATLRFDDTKAVTPAATQALEHMWRYELARTKTTGPGRKRLAVQSYIRRFAYFVCPGWHATFMQLLCEGPLAYPCDYLVPLPAPGFDDVAEGMADERRAGH